METRHLSLSVVLALFFCAACCLMPLFHRVGEDYLTIGAAAILALTGIIMWTVKADDIPFSFSTADILLVLLFVFILCNASFQQSVGTPVFYWKWAAAAGAFLIGKQLTESYESLLIVLTIPALVQAVIVIFQALGILPSNSFFFPTSGTFGNPSFPATIISLGIVSLLPTLFRLSSSDSHGTARKFLVAAIGLCLLIALVCCKSRGGLLAVAVCFSACLLKRKRSKKAIVATIILLLFFIVGLYFIRPGSADVRLLIWRASAGLFAQHPLFGAGATSFSANYMYAQADYFAEHPDSPFILLAGNHFQPYNEIIRLLCEQGIIGTFLFLLFFASLLKNAGNQILPLLALGILFLTFNVSDLFVLYLLFWLLAGRSSAPAHHKLLPGFCCGKIAAVGIMTAILVLATIRFFDRSYMENPEHSAEIPTYEAVCEQGIILQDQGNLEEAEHLFQLAWHMIPCRITATYLLFRLYRERDPETARQWGMFILEKQPLRSVSGRTLQMKSEIKEYLSSSRTGF